MGSDFKNEASEKYLLCLILLKIPNESVICQNTRLKTETVNILY